MEYAPSCRAREEGNNCGQSAATVYEVDIASELKTEEDIEGFIEASIEEAKDDTDPRHLIHALETAARARGMLKTAKEADVDRANLYRILSGET